MTDTQTEEATTAAPPREGKTYRVFKFEERPEGKTWMELNLLVVEPNSYGSAYLTATRLGEEWGAGEYMYFDTGNDWPRTEFLTVEARTEYHEAEKAEVSL